MATRTANATPLHRTGSYVTQPGGYRAFIPHSLPFATPLKIDDSMLALLSEATLALGRLDAAADILPNPDLFVRMYVRKEAVLSSQIEGTQASLTDVLEYEAAERRRATPDMREVLNYVDAMNYGLHRLAEDFPLSNRLLREIHQLLMRGVRGQNKSPGEFRTSQNWVGSPGSGLRDALFVPPPPGAMGDAMGDLEKFIHNPDPPFPVLLKGGLLHAQFESIHPFLDGNGRMGRLLVTFYLCQQEALKRPLLYLSAYFRQNQQEYYERLQAVRDKDDIENWVRFFLEAVLSVAQEAAHKARAILRLREDHRQLVQEAMAGSPNALKMLDLLVDLPVTTIPTAAHRLGVSYPTAATIITKFESLGLMRETTGQDRNRRYRYDPYIELLQI